MPRLVRSLLAAAIAAGVLPLAATAAHAAPPEGCYGFPSIPDAFFCIEGFAPTNAVPDVGTGTLTSVTIPEFCVGDCFGPITVPVPGPSVSGGDQPVMTVVYKGQEYPVVVGDVPPLPPVGTDSCGTDYYYDEWGNYYEVEGFGLHPVGCAWIFPDGVVRVTTCAADAVSTCRTVYTPYVDPATVETLLWVVSCIADGQQTLSVCLRPLLTSTT